MKSNLAYIGKIANAAVEHPRTMIKTEHVGGFPIETEVPLNSGYWEQGKKDYVASAEILKTRLAVRGVEPIAIIPTAWWNAMAKESGLWVLRPDREGTVGINEKDTVKAARASNLPAVIWVVGVGASVATAMSLTWGLPVTLATNAILLLIGTLFTLATTCAFRAIFKKTGDRIAAQFQAAFHVIRHGRTRVMSGMLTENNPVHRIGISLPTPPENVVETLRKIASLPGIKVAAEPGAVGFEKSPTKIIADSIVDEWDYERKEAARLRALDPIIYLEEGPAVAIVAQFGEFPIEKEIVDQVVARQSSLRLRD